MGSERVESLGTAAIIAGIVGLAVSLVLWVEFLTVGGYLLFFTPFPLDVVVALGVLWGPLLWKVGLVSRRKERAVISS